MRVCIVIDGEEFHIAPTRVEHLVEFLKIVRNQYYSQDRFIRSIALNGQEIDGLSADNIHKAWLASKEMTIRIETDDPIDTAFHSVDQIHRFLTKLIYDINMCSEYFQINALDKADSLWAYSMAGVDWVLQGLKEVENYLYINTHQKIPVVNSSLQELQHDIKKITQNALQLFYKEDYTQLGKTLETDLCDSLVRLQKALESINTFREAA